MNRNTYLVHHGIKGQKWGIRRYQNYDGSLTNAGKRHYSVKYAKKDNAEKIAIAIGAATTGKAIYKGLKAGATTATALYGKLATANKVIQIGKYAVAGNLAAAIPIIVTTAAIAAGKHYAKQKFTQQAYYNAIEEKNMAGRLGA